MAVVGRRQETLGRQLTKRLGVEIGVEWGACPDPRNPAFINRACTCRRRMPAAMLVPGEDL